jgi:MtN3 and saliva related transmembrane protein
MQTPMIDAIGLAAGFLTTLSFLPQALKIHRSRSAQDISPPMFAALSVGVSLWLAYGLLKQDWAIVITNVVTLALAGWILLMKLRFS